MFHPVHTFISKLVTDFNAKQLLHEIFVDGELVYDLPGLQDIQAFARENLDLLWAEYRRSLNPEEYPVDLSQDCWDNKMRNIEAVKEKIDRLRK